METLQKAMIVLMLVFIASCTQRISEEDIYATGALIESSLGNFDCKPEQSTRECFRLTTNSTRCYYLANLTRYDVCTGGKWEAVAIPTAPKAQAKEYRCEFRTGCKEVT